MVFGSENQGFRVVVLYISSKILEKVLDKVSEFLSSFRGPKKMKNCDSGFNCNYIRFSENTRDG